MSYPSDHWEGPKGADASSGEPVAAQSTPAASTYGYGPPQPGNAAPHPGYGPPHPGYAPPQTGYGPPQPGNAAPHPGYSPPQTGYGPPHPGYSPPQTGYGPPYAGYGPTQAGYAPPTYGYGQPSFAAPPPAYHPAGGRAGGWNTGGWGGVAGVRAGSSAAKREAPLAVVIGLAVVILALIAGGTVGLVRPRGSALKGLTAAQILDKSLTAARKARTVHVAATHSDSDSTVQVSMDISPSGGTDTETVDGGTANIIEVNGQVYFKADASYWKSQLGAPQSFIAKYSDKWLKVPANSPDLRLAADVLKMPTIVDQLLALSGAISKGRAAAKGQLTVTGTVPYNDFNRDSGAGDLATLAISSESPFLPVSISYSDPDTGTNTMTFSNWGEQVPLAAPPSPLTPSPGGATTA